MARRSDGRFGDGRVSIHYCGWAASYDEVVPRSRLRLPPAQPKTVSVFGEGFSQSGLLVDDIEDFLVLEIPSGAKQFINKRKIVYFEVHASSDAAPDESASTE